MNYLCCYLSVAWHCEPPRTPLRRSLLFDGRHRTGPGRADEAATVAFGAARINAVAARIERHRYPPAYDLCVARRGLGSTGPVEVRVGQQEAYRKDRNR